MKYLCLFFIFFSLKSPALASDETKSLIFIVKKKMPPFSYQAATTSEDLKTKIDALRKELSGIEAAPASKDLKTKIDALLSGIEAADFPVKSLPAATEHVSVLASKVITTIKETKAVLCKAIDKKGEIKFWLTVGADAKVLGIGGSSESGIEVTVHCNSSTSQ